MVTTSGPLQRATTSTDHAARASARTRVTGELRELLINAAYLALFLCAFTVYRALITGELQDRTIYIHFGTSIITALVIAKTIMIGGWLNVGRAKHRAQRLIVRTLYMSLVYGVFIFAISVLERILVGFVHRTDVRETIHTLARLGWQEITARTIVVLLALVPYFAFRELALAEGRNTIADVFLGKAPARNE